MALNIRLRRLDVRDLLDLFRNCETSEGDVGRWSDQWLTCKRLEIGSRGIESCDSAEGIRFAEKQRAKPRLTEFDRVFQHGLEHGIKIAGRAGDNLQHFRRRRLLLQRLVQPALEYFNPLVCIDSRRLATTRGLWRIAARQRFAALRFYCFPGRFIAPAHT